MKGKMIPISVLFILFALIILGGGAMAWLSIVITDEPSPTQETLLNTADWLVKASAGALFGFASGSGLVNGKARCRS